MASELGAEAEAHRNGPNMMPSDTMPSVTVGAGSPEMAASALSPFPESRRVSIPAKSTNWRRVSGAFRACS
jgi:hypothetical protein